MKAAVANRIEKAASRFAAGSFGLACAYGLNAWLAPLLGRPAGASVAAAVAIVAFILGSRSLDRIGGEAERASAPQFDLAEIEPEPLPELLLTDVHASAAEADTLVLDDILAELQPDSRVVRLFDRSAMPTPGQLKSRIDAHLGREGHVPAPDASQALHDALAELRRSIG